MNNKYFSIICLIAINMAMTTYANAARDRRIVSLDVAITTANERNAGTDADIYLAIHWTNNHGKSLGKVLKMPDLRGDENRRNMTTRYSIDLGRGVIIRDLIQGISRFNKVRIPVQNISGITLINGMNGRKPGWKIRSIRIMARDNRGSVWEVVNVANYRPYANLDKWLETSKSSTSARPLTYHVRPFASRDEFETSPKMRVYRNSWFQSPITYQDPDADKIR